MNKRETVSLGIFLVSFFLLGFVFFSGLQKDVIIKLENGKTISSQVPHNFPLAHSVSLMILSALASTSFFYFASDLGNRLKLTRNQQLTVNMLEGDVRNVYMFILEKGACLQKDLVYEMKLPKAKVTRILHKLDAKGLVKRISYGKTNKIVVE